MRPSATCLILSALVAISTTGAEKKQPWSLKPVAAVQPPSSARNPIDAFLMQAREKKGVRSIAQADRATLLRRVSLDLIGLPPTPDELKQFVEDRSLDAYEKAVDRLLSSRHHGERYARHWLDVLRYADVDENMPTESGIFLYRDWVISALNRDLSYKEFVRAQLLGEQTGRPEDLFASGFLARAAHSVEDKDQELAIGATETTALAFMGMTVGCAKCHDHMFDPISQRDYYAMKALFDPLVVDKRTLATPDQIVRYSEELARYNAQKAEIERPLKAFLEPFEKKLVGERISMFTPEVQAAIRKPEKDRTAEEQKIYDDYAPVIRIDPPKFEEVMTKEEVARYRELRKPLRELKPPAPLPTFWTVREDAKRTEAKNHILLGGDPEKPGPEVQPGFPFAPNGISFHRGRIETFADWLTDDTNPLFARVAVNRIWQWHFGEALVPTPNDFGVMGRRPSHPELLDWLAAEFVRQNYSMKAMHRLIVTSDAYKLASTGEPETVSANMKADPKNTLLWRFRLQRLDAEAVRDSILWASGDLDLTMGGKSFRDGPEQKRLGSQAIIGNYDTKANRRGIYMGRGFHSDREMMPSFLQVFDAEDGRESCPRRNQTVTPPQALTLMNSDLVSHSSDKLGDRLRTSCEGDLSRAVELGYLTTLSRTPTGAEKDRALSYLNNDPARLSGFGWLLFNLDEFLYIR